jgi:hypothetical protein
MSLRFLQIEFQKMIFIFGRTDSSVFQFYVCKTICHSKGYKYEISDVSRYHSDNEAAAELLFTHASVVDTMIWIWVAIFAIWDASHLASCPGNCSANAVGCVVS